MDKKEAIVEEDLFRDRIATVDKSGKRIWIYPKKPKGPWYNKRKWLSYFLLILLFGFPFLQWKGQPLMLFNVLDSEFILFGFPFTTQDFHIFVIAMLIGMIFIALFTVIYGRVFCGWICPQTIFMEMVFRRIEYWIEGDARAQKKLDQAPWTPDKVLKKGSKHLLFILISILIAHTFLSYIIGIDKLWVLLSDPVSQHWSGFVAMIVFTILFYGVFSIMREQVCTTICPYGRMQSVLLDKNSLAVSYDFVRGEPRGKKKRAQKLPKAPCTNACENCKTTSSSCSSDSVDHFIPLETIQTIGDCVDCNLCVQVCPTGIDIRNGTQLECVNCTACMDACDEVMIKIDREPGLIRIDSYNGIKEGKKTIWTKRAWAYSVVLVLLIGLESFMFASRSEVECLFLRTPGMSYQDRGDGYIGNLYNYQLINKTRQDYPVQFTIEDIPGVRFETIGADPIAQDNKVSEGAVFIHIPKEQLNERKMNLKIQVISGDEVIETTKTTFFSPIK